MRARGGRRDDYRAIETPLSQSADPVDVAAGLRRLYPFTTLYCADLDAVEGRVPNAAAVDTLCAQPDAPAVWLDAGFREVGTVEAALANPLLHPVIGTESQSDARLLGLFAANRRVILSLDFFADGHRGPKDILDHAELWPQTVIVMTLARVGADGGPDFERLLQIRRRAGDRMVVAAGGVRHAGDIETLSAMGIGAALVASALHDGTIAPAQLAALQR